MLSMQISIRGMGKVFVLVTEFTLRQSVEIRNVNAKCPMKFWYKNTRRTPFTLTRFYKVIIQQILNFFSENLLFCRVHSAWIVFQRF